MKLNTSSGIERGLWVSKNAKNQIIGIANSKGLRFNQTDINISRKKDDIRLIPLFIKPIYICPAPGNNENQKVKNALFFLIIKSILSE
jgi:hypothetical protein